MQKNDMLTGEARPQTQLGAKYPHNLQTIYKPNRADLYRGHQHIFDSHR